MDFNAPPILPSIFATPILPSIFATHHHGFDLEFSKSIIDLLHPDACKRADYLHMLVEFENHATKLMTLPLYEQQTLVRVLSEIQHPSAIKLWAIIFGVACESSVAGDLFLHLLQPPNFPEDAWQQLPSLGNSFLYKISKNIVFQGFSPRIVQGEWGALRHSVACAIIEAGHMTLGIDGPPTIAALFPMDTIRPRVERALQDLETLRNCNGDSINEIIENAIKTLEPEEGPELKISKAAQENLTQAASFLTLGVCLIYSSITGPDDVSQLLSPLPISTIDLVCTLAYAATLALLASNSEVTTTFAAFYLMDDRSSLLEQEFGTVSHPFIFALPFRYVALNTFDILGVDFKPFFNVVEKGMLSATTPFLGTYVFNGPVQHNLAEHLAAKLSDFHANSAAELSLIHPVAFNMGWVQKKGVGHALWGIAHNKTVELINSGSGLSNHCSFPSRKGNANLYTLTTTRVASSDQEFHNYLKASFLLSAPGCLEQLAEANSHPVDPSSLSNFALKVLYSMQPGQEKDDVMAIHAQKSITCCVKSLKLLTRKYFPSHNRKFHFVGKMMVYALWHRQLDDKGRGTEFKVELRQTLAKELFRRLFDANVGIKALSQLAHYFCTDPNWMWESSYMIHRVYTAALATNDTQIVTFWLSYLFKKSSPVAVQCLADVLNACFTTGDIDMCCQALRKAVNAHKNLNTFYCDLAARMPHFADFPWQCIALRDFHLVERIRCDMAANPKSANVLALFDHAMSKGRGNYYVSSFVI